MFIKQKRLVKFPIQLARLDKNEKIRIGMTVTDELAPLLIKVGFSNSLSTGEKVLPAADFGPISRFNAQGRYSVHKDRPKETAFRQVEWHWNQWCGRGQSEEHSKIVDVPYQRYPRTFVPPASVELSLCNNSNGSQLLISPEYSLHEKSSILHVLNLFLECFGYCHILRGDFSKLAPPKCIHLNWTILPKGKMPWNSLKSNMTEMLSAITTNNRVVVEHRFETINRYSPEFVAVGRAGFRGYVVFGFPEISLYVLESIYTGNATYVFDSKWEELSKLSKAEILNESLQLYRIIHRKGWEYSLMQILKNKKAA